VTRHRLAIAISSAVAACFLAVGLSAAGYGPLPRQDANEAPSALGEAALGEAAAVADMDMEPEVVYVQPAPNRKTVVVTQRARTAETASRGTVQPRSRSIGGDDDDRDDHERERHDDDDDERHEDRDRDEDDDRERDDD
jgi:hypothetical protein